MSDLTDIQAAQSVKIVGASSVGSEQTPIQSTSEGSLYSQLRGLNPSGVETSERVSGISTGNSTSTPLGVSGTFTGTFVDTLGYTNIAVSIFTDQASATNGLIIEYSSDGTNVDSNELYTITANNGGQYSFGVLTRYVRVRYINDGIAQTIFRLQTLLHVFAPKPSSHRIDDSITGQNDAELSKAVITGKQENGSFANVGLSNTASIKVAVTDRPSEVRSRTRIEAHVSNATLTAANTVIYTVTGGKTLYLESFISSVINNTNAIGEWRLRDNTTDKMSFLMAEKSVGAAAAASTNSPFLPEPIPFTTSVTANEISGDIRLSFYLIGYEE